ncbi:hypothetical protein BABINDRAFT_160040 [Babjeviella inositovora NRRL Y-12698]|uniref:HAD-like protein n=1 Tax=Babjeviella inositovora NRRL Y-12698 TaxID=984486 RepID=A0A1E3QVW0_9ASCO|nr:uncharacterized protein BABINDRAFT_160040 [Babjeviella inositovora NRRL Y-12698]ODQ81800.1 hypothetical protein BABINDRAFT_160040 [Babjeviella inositovora NRRL Y-12698]
MYEEFRTTLGLAPDSKTDILHHIAALSPAEQEQAHHKIEAVEVKAMTQMQPQPGLSDIMAYITKNNLPRAIVTRNKMVPVNHLMSQFMESHHVFDPIITRDFLPTKPDPAPLLHVIHERWAERIDPEDVMMVGDSIDDMQAGASAGCVTVLVAHEKNGYLRDRDIVDYVVKDLGEIVGLLESGVTSKVR